MNPKTKALTPFQIVGKNVKAAGSSVGRALRKVAGKVMGPTVRVMKNEDAQMQEMYRKAKSGEFN